MEHLFAKQCIPLQTVARSISIADFTYILPDERIAQFPLADRANSKLLQCAGGVISDHVFHQLPDLLPVGCTLVFNTTKVVCARMLFPIEGKQKPVEIFVLEPQSGITMEQAMHTKGTAVWKCLVGNNKHFSEARIRRSFISKGETYFIEVEKPLPSGDAFLVRFTWSDALTFSELLDAFGQIPLPPYMKRTPEAGDSARYQTVYAREEGSVAAPTAGLHFTDDVLAQLRKRQIYIEQVTLHVGAGTFRPVKASTMEGHDMHAEEISITQASIAHLLQYPQQLIAVGTTSLRTLESLFWIGWKWQVADRAAIPAVYQWDAYDTQVPADFTYEEALKVILMRMETYGLTVLTTKTQLLIAPGYHIRSAKGLITNFHQPNSTLLLLVATFIGDDWKKVYAHALENDYRFLSYGDSSLLWRQDD